MRLTEKTRQSSPSDVSDYDVCRHLWRVNWRQYGYPYCGIYVISPDTRWPCKVGISQNPVKRLISLQNAHWRKLDIAEYRYCADAHKARAVERKCHEILRDDGKLMYGEWFDIRPEKALEIMEFAALALDIEIMNSVPDAKLEQVLNEFNVTANNKKTQQLRENW